MVKKSKDDASGIVSEKRFSMNIQVDFPKTHSDFLEIIEKILLIDRDFFDIAEDRPFPVDGDYSDSFRRHDIVAALLEKFRSQHIDAVIDSLFDNLQWDTLGGIERAIIIRRILDKLRYFPSSYDPVDFENPPKEKLADIRLYSYKDRPKGMSAIEYIRHVYGKFLTGEFTRADLRRVDPDADMGLRNYEKRHGRTSLEELNLPTLKQKNDQLGSSLEDLSPNAQTAIRDANRIRAAIQRRQAKKNPNS